MSSVPPGSGVKSADRAIDLLEHIAGARGDMSHAALAEALSIPKSSLTPLLRNLIARGYVIFSSVERTYRLGPALFELVRKAATHRGLVAESEPILLELTRRLGETCSLNILCGDQSEVAATCLGPSRLVTHMRLGDRAPLYATSGGKALLAFMPESSLLAYLEGVELRPVTPATITAVAVLERQLVGVRSSGFAYVMEEYTLGIVGIATPVLDRSGAALAALSVAVPKIRFTDDTKKDIEHLLRRARTELQERLRSP